MLKKNIGKEYKRLTNAYTCILYSNSTHNTHTAPVECLLKPIFPPSLEGNLPTLTKTICPCYGVTEWTISRFKTSLIDHFTTAKYPKCKTFEIFLNTLLNS